MRAITKIKFVGKGTLLARRLTVAIGPNNGGKSRFLREIANAVTGSTAPQLVIADVVLNQTVVTTAVNALTSRGLDENGNYIFDGMAPDFGSVTQQRPSPGWVNPQLAASGGPKQLLNIVGPHLIAQLTTERRLALVKQQMNRNESVQAAQSPLQAAYESDPSVMWKVNDYVSKAFQQQLVLDKSEFAVAQFRVAPLGGAPADGTDPKVMAAFGRLDDQGDGIRAFCGLVVSSAVVSRPIILIDEPEAFLHPPQAFVAGRSVAHFSRADHQLVIATDSSEVLRGMLAETTALDILRFARSPWGYTRRKLKPSTLKAIADNPVLSSARILDGLFYDGVIIVESDGDAVVYRRVLEQLGLGGVYHFVSSYSKQLTCKVAEPYIEMDVPHAVIVDFDLLRRRDETKAMAVKMGVPWSEIEGAYDLLTTEIEGADTPEARVVEVHATISEMQRLLSESDDPRRALTKIRRSAQSMRETASIWSDLKKSGIGKLSSAAGEAFATIDTAFRKNGVFVVPVGEREAWLPETVPYSANKNRWTGEALIALKKRLKRTHPLTTFITSVVEHLSK